MAFGEQVVFLFSFRIVIAQDVGLRVLLLAFRESDCL